MSTATTSRYRGRGNADRVPRTERIYSEREHGFVLSLNRERAVPPAGRDEREATLLERNFDLLGNHATFDPETDKRVSSAEAGLVIDYLLLLPGRPDAPGPMVTGLYRRDGVLFLVRWNKQKTRTNATELSEPDLGKTYRPDVTDLAEGERLADVDAGPIMTRLMFGR